MNKKYEGILLLKMNFLLNKLYIILKIEKTHDFLKVSYI